MAIRNMTGTFCKVVRFAHRPARANRLGLLSSIRCCVAQRALLMPSRASRNFCRHPWKMYDARTWRKYRCLRIRRRMVVGYAANTCSDSAVHWCGLVTSGARYAYQWRSVVSQAQVVNWPPKRCRVARAI